MKERPLRLANILLAIANEVGWVKDNWVNAVFEEWDIQRDSLIEQSPMCIQSIYSLLGGHQNPDQDGLGAQHAPNAG